MIETITIDGKEHKVADFSPTVQQLIAIRTKWSEELVAERLTAAKTEAAIKGLDSELTAKVTEELAGKEQTTPPKED